MWQELIDRFLGFLPQRAALYSGILYAVICFVALKTSEKMTSSYSLPWQKEENRKAREQIKKEGEGK